MVRPIYDLLSKGQSILVKGNKNSYQVANAIKKNIFKAHIQETSTPLVPSSIDLPPVTLKTEDHPVIRQREVDVYEFDCIRKSPYIRPLHDVIDNGTDKCMVLQWMDSDLWSLRKQRHELNPKLPKIVAKSVLKALTAFNDMDGQGVGVHTDVNPNNILVDRADTLSTTVKLSDLGGLIRAYEEQDYRLQGFAIRAPEIWMGKAPTPACDVWSLGVSVRFRDFLEFQHLKLIEWLVVGTFPYNEAFLWANRHEHSIPSKPHEMTQAAWSLGRIMQLFGPLPRNENLEFTEEFNLVEILMKRGVIKTGPFTEEMSKFDVSGDCIQFLQHILNIDPRKRPTAVQALQHPWLQDID